MESAYSLAAEASLARFTGGSLTDSADEFSLAFTFAAALEGATMIAHVLHENALLHAAGHIMHSATTAALHENV